ncbi:MAG: ribonuclease R [Candidatus Coproplasma sp.]
MDLRKTILSAFKSGKLENKTQNEIISALHLPPSYKKPAKAVIKNLASEGLIVKVDGGKYLSPERAGAFCATVKANAGGYAFLIPDGFLEREHDYFVPAKRLNGALDKDKVMAIPVGRGDEAMVLKILERGTRTVTGRLVRGRGNYFVIPDDRAFGADVLIPRSLLEEACEGDKVIAEITAHNRDFVNGKIIKVLGVDGDFMAEEEAIIASAELNTEFPPYVIETADKVAGERVVLGERVDLRDLLTVTIDGVDTRDIDDAVSLEIVDGNYRLGVHIADVSHYVKYNGCIDKEAYERGTSVYFPDRVLPMLPKSLSNGACSLNEGKDRYAMSCFMTFNSNGKKLGYEICESVINSDRRLTYDEVTAVIERGEEGIVIPEIAQMLKAMGELCLKLEAIRRADGEVSLDVKEAHIYVDEQGEIVIPDYERALSHRLIEQFMVSANESVADFAQRKTAPFLYRIHEKPSPEKVSLLYNFLKELGVKVSNADTEETTPKDFQKILTLVEDKPFAAVVNKVMLRSMQKARYSEENLGHFGLASRCYCHFTSPIRRYPDLFVHRVLKILLHGQDEEKLNKFRAIAKTCAVDTSERERRAEQAERDVDDLYKLEYMRGRIGEQFDAVVSGVIESGIFAELTNTVEGFIRCDLLPDDYYDYYPEKFLLKGRRHSFKLGDSVKVEVIGCDLCTRRIQFALV